MDTQRNKKPDDGNLLVEENLLERIAYITKELDEVVEITKGIEPPQSNSKIRVPTSIQSIFKYLVLKNVSQGRMALSVYFSGKEVGYATQARTPEAMVKLSRRLDMGKLEIKKFSDDDVCLEIIDGLSSRDVETKDSNVCFFEAGFLGGVAENILGRKVDFREVQCRAHHGGDRCVFKMLKTGEEYRIEGVTIPLLKMKGYSPENVKMLTSLAAHSIAAIENALVFETTRKQSLIDGLTEVYNHRFFQQTIRTELKRAQRHNEHVSLVMCDLDKFKEYNDNYSHLIGDDVLKKVARILIGSIRDIDYVARYGGDEFGIILPKTNYDGALIVAQRLKERIAKCIFPEDGSGKALSVSLGIVSASPDDKIDPKDFINRADQALLAAKKVDKKLVLAKDL